MSTAPTEISKAYEPKLVEDKWYADWLAKGSFTANPASTKPAYSIVIPPPNVTGVLTMGHVLNNTLQDILARRKRMQGFEVLWLPGTDHAGIATQTVVEKTLIRSDLYLADEAFMTGTAAEVTPLSAVDDVEIGVGPITLELQEAYLDTARGRSERWAQWLEYATPAPAEA